MRENRTLQLRRDRLAELTTTDMREMAGATRGDSCHITWGWGCPTDPIPECLSLDRPCIQTA